MSFEAEEQEPLWMRLGRVVLASLLQVVVIAVFYFAGAYASRMLGAAPPEDLTALLTLVALGVGFSAAGSLLDRSPVSIMLSFLSKLVQLYALLVGVGAPFTVMEVGLVRVELWFEPLILVLVVWLLVSSLLDAANLFLRSA